ncbi:MAG: radical SAM protein [Candidatus Thermoplasmatota archaeon]
MTARILRAYYVWPAFPSVSITGSACALSCRHCMGTYLRCMIPATTPEALVQQGRRFSMEGKHGLLVSGGCDAKGGMLNLDKFLPALRALHGMGLIIKLHTGLVDEALARGIAEAGVDIASTEIVGHEDTIREVFGIDADPGDYIRTISLLRDAGVPYLAPHIAVGLHHGTLKGEKHALSMLREAAEPSTIVFIVLRPTKGTPMEHLSAPSAGDVAEVIEYGRGLFPQTKIVLGALRPRGSDHGSEGRNARLAIEMAALDSGVDGIEHPSRALLRSAEATGCRVKRIAAYGVLPIEYEDRVEWRWVR